MKINQTDQYLNQYFDVEDDKRTSYNDKIDTCNITCVAMLTGENPNVVLNYFLREYGLNEKHQWEEYLINYLKSKKFECEPVTYLAYPESKIIHFRDLSDMREQIDKGNIIFYHEKGHYMLMVGYEQDESGKYNYIFNDPAGDRKIGYSERSRESGFNVVYPESFLKARPLFGQCWVISK